MARELLLKEIKAAHGFPFLNLHHDGWSTGNGKVSVLGTSASFIDETWEYREIALLLRQCCKRLEEIQKFFCLPIMGTTLACDTRVAFSVKRFQRTIVNDAAFATYFQKQEKGEDASVFECLSFADWRLVTEMEAIVCSIADLTRVEVQRKELVSSELIVLLKFASDRLDSSKFSDQVSVASLIRPSKRAKAKADEEDGADKIADDRAKQTIAEGNKLLVDAHREVFCALNAPPSSASHAATAIASPNLDLVPCVDDDKVICGASIPVTTPDATPLQKLHDQADKVLQDWMK
ncbi:hypothetical protein GQ600_10716 [Phytophthora cactorum]|nr:hypothetical protein GQ600_10716 [Phytophthora cactorum]